MACTIFGVPNPYSTQWRDRIGMRSKNGFSKKVSGSTGGKSPVLKPMAQLLVSAKGCDKGR